MSAELFTEIGVVRSDDLEEGPVTPGQIRRKALEAGDLWVGECHVTALDQPSQWHHHKDFDSVMYMLSGRIRVDHVPSKVHNVVVRNRFAGQLHATFRAIQNFTNMFTQRVPPTDVGRRVDIATVYSKTADQQGQSGGVIMLLPSGAVVGNSIG